MTATLHAIIRATTALAAIAATAGMIVGIPIVLWLVTWPLLRDGFPAGLTPVDLLLRPDDGTLLMLFIAIVGAVAWLILTVSIVAEFAAAMTGRPSPRIDLPGFRVGRSVAAALVAAVLGASPALADTTSMTPVSIAATRHDVPPVAGADQEASRGPEDDPIPRASHVVRHRETLWRIAEVTLGDPMRWREIYDLNEGRPQSDGGRLTEASHLSIGWILQLPGDARETVVVEPGDTLIGLSDEHLGDAARDDDLFAANTGTPQPDGAVLSDPDVILPGWTLVLPDRTDEPSPAELPDSSTRLPPTSSDSETPDTAAPPTEEPPTLRPSTAATPAVADGPPRNEDDDAAATEVAEWVLPAIGVSGGVLAALALRRRRQQRRRPFRHKIAVPSDEDGRWEGSLTRAADDGAGQLSDARHLELALRSLTHPDSRADDDAIPVVRSARLTDTHALITTTGAGTLPSPFTPTTETHVWGLDVDTPLPVPLAEASGCCSPFPTLVSIATDASADRTLMIDLEERGVLLVGGNHQRAIALVRHIAAELATSPGAEDTEVLLVGFDDGWDSLNPERLRGVEDLAAALTVIEQRSVSTRAALDRWQLGSAVEGRLRDVAADSWLPTVLLATTTADEDEHVRLRELAAAAPGATAVAIVVVDNHDPDLVIDAGGNLELPDVHDGPWQAAQLTDTAGTHLVALLGTTDAPPMPVEPVQTYALWAANMNEDGTLAVDVFDSHSGDRQEKAVLEPQASDELKPERGDPTEPPAGGDPIDADPPPTQTNRAAGLEPTSEKDGLAGCGARRLAITQHQDQHLDDDVVAWYAPSAPCVPMIAILGEPIVRAPGPAPTNRPSWFAEVLVYLSLHPSGVTPSKAVTDLWPDGHRISPATIRHAFYGARKWAGRGLDGDPDAAFVSDMQHDSTYRLRGHLLDWDLFRRLRKRGQARHGAQDPGAADDYRAALDLLRGPVLSALRPGGYAWLNNHDQRHDLQIPGFVIDTAHELVDIALAANDTATARWAAEQARATDVDVAFDRPLTDLMRIAHAEDNRAELELCAAILLDARGFDVPEELAPESFIVLNELLPAGPRRPRP